MDHVKRAHPHRRLARKRRQLRRARPWCEPSRSAGALHIDGGSGEQIADKLNHVSPPVFVLSGKRLGVAFQALATLLVARTVRLSSIAYSDSACAIAFGHSSSKAFRRRGGTPSELLKFAGSVEWSGDPKITLRFYACSSRTMSDRSQRRDRAASSSLLRDHRCRKLRSQLKTRLRYSEPIDWHRRPASSRIGLRKIPCWCRGRCCSRSAREPCRKAAEIAAPKSSNSCSCCPPGVLADMRDGLRKRVDTTLASQSMFRIAQPRRPLPFGSRPIAVPCDLDRRGLTTPYREIGSRMQGRRGTGTCVGEMVAPDASPHPDGLQGRGRRELEDLGQMRIPT